MEKFIEGHRLVVRVSDGKLRARDEARAKCGQKEGHCKNQRLHGRTMRNRLVIPFAESNRPPIEGDRNRWGRIFWPWWSHEVISRVNLWALGHLIVQHS